MVLSDAKREEHVRPGSEGDQERPAEQKRQSGTAISGDTHDEDAAADDTLSENTARFRTGSGSEPA